MKKIVLFIFTTVISLFAAHNTSGITNISMIYSYPSNESVLFKVSNPTVECTGYFFNKSDIGYDANLSMVLSAYHAQNDLKIYAVPTVLFKGSSAKFCKVHAIVFYK